MSVNLALIGFGEAASTFASAGQWGPFARAFDILPERTAMMAWQGVLPCAQAEEALTGAPLVLSLVTADQALSAAWACAQSLTPAAIWCDMNSVAPGTKKAAAAAIEAAGGRYVDVAILAPVKPAGLAVPLLLSGKAAHKAAALLRFAGFTNLRILDGEVGHASTVKMLRSVMVKGIEALTAEMMSAAKAAGLASEVLASLDATERRDCWTERADYNLERMRTHGARRAAEMEEVAKTLEALGVEPVMTRGTVSRQREMDGKGKPE